MGSVTTFQCLSCRHVQRAEVRVRGAARAPRDAQPEVHTRIAMLLALTRCPRCGYFDRGVASHNRHSRRFAQLTLGGLALATVIALFLIPAVSPLIFAIVGCALVVGCFALAYSLRDRYPTSVEGRVVLTDR